MKELKETKEEKDTFKKDLIRLREQQAEAEHAKQELAIEVADLMERLNLKQIELDTKAALLTSAKEKIDGYNEIMHGLHENEK